MTVFLRRFSDSGSSCEKHCFSKISPRDDLLIVNDLYAPFPHTKHKVAGYCNGLFCLDYDNGKILLWNPSTNEFKFLPTSDLKPPPCTDNDCTVHVISRVCGLGFDPKSGDYKVVRLVDSFHSKQVEVYSLKNDCWKEISPVENVEYCNIVDECATYVDGFCYWIAQRKSFPSEIIVSFDLSNDKFSALGLPGWGQGLSEFGYILMEFKETLGLLIYKRMGNDKLLHHWVRDTNKNGGPRWIRIMDSKVEGERPLGFCRNGELLLLEGFDSKLLVYDYVARELRKIDGIYDYPHCMQLFPYVESTFLLSTCDDKITLARPRRFQDTSARPSNLLKIKMFKRKSRRRQELKTN